MADESINAASVASYHRLIVPGVDIAYSTAEFVSQIAIAMSNTTHAQAPFHTA